MIISIRLQKTVRWLVQRIHEISKCNAFNLSHSTSNRLSKIEATTLCVYVLRTNTGQSVRIHLISERN